MRKRKDKKAGVFYGIWIVIAGFGCVYLLVIVTILMAGKPKPYVPEP